MLHLFHGAQAGTDLRMALAAVGFIGCSLGSALAWLGAHVHDEVEIAERWRNPAG
jgi:hypothetical protein